jgi:hypothetical protein
MLYKELGGPPTSSKNNHQYSNALSKGKKNPNRERSMPPEQKKKTKQLPRVTLPDAKNSARDIKKISPKTTTRKRHGQEQ